MCHNSYLIGRSEAVRKYGFLPSKSQLVPSSSDTDSSSSDDEQTKLKARAFVPDQRAINLRQARIPFGLLRGCGDENSNEPRWPIEIEVLPEARVKHIFTSPTQPELFYKPMSNHNHMPFVRSADEANSRVVFKYNPETCGYFIRSRIGGNREGCRPATVAIRGEDDATVIFESRFESGNLMKAVQVGEYEYELYLRYDLYTKRNTQWFYFRLENIKSNKRYRFTIVNFFKPTSLYNIGMKPLMYSVQDAETKGIGWRRWGEEIVYYKNTLPSPDNDGTSLFSLSWTCKFPNDHDTYYFAHCYPYTYSDLQNYLTDIQTDRVKSQYCKQKILCRTLAGNFIYLLTITNPSSTDHPPNSEQVKKGVVVTARVHPGETNGSWMMKGLLDFLLGNSPDAKILRDNFIFKIIPMLNPDGVIVGNYRCSLSGRDLNRNYKTILKEAYPSIWHTREMIKRFMTETELVLYCDFHGHSRKQNIFIYGCENKHLPNLRLKERLFPAMLSKNDPTKFSYCSCKFKVQKHKEGTGRVVMWSLGILNSYTLEATFCGSTLDDKAGQHFTMEDLESVGYHFLDSLLDYCDPDPTKCRQNLYEALLNGYWMTTEDALEESDYTIAPDLVRKKSKLSLKKQSTIILDSTSYNKACTTLSSENANRNRPLHAVQSAPNSKTRRKSSAITRHSKTKRNPSKTKESKTTYQKSQQPSCKRLLNELEDDLRHSIQMKLLSRGMQPSSLADIDLDQFLSDDDSSDDGGSDSSIDDGLPKHLEAMAVAKLRMKKTRTKTLTAKKKDIKQKDETDKENVDKSKTSRTVGLVLTKTKYSQLSSIGMIETPDDDASFSRRKSRRQPVLDPNRICKCYACSNARDEKQMVTTDSDVGNNYQQRTVKQRRLNDNLSTNKVVDSSTRINRVPTLSANNRISSGNGVVDRVEDRTKRTQSDYLNLLTQNILGQSDVLSSAPDTQIMSSIEQESYALRYSSTPSGSTAIVNEQQLRNDHRDAFTATYLLKRLNSLEQDSTVISSNVTMPLLNQTPTIEEQDDDNDDQMTDEECEVEISNEDEKGEKASLNNYVTKQLALHLNDRILCNRRTSRPKSTIINNSQNYRPTLDIRQIQSPANQILSQRRLFDLQQQQQRQKMMMVFGKQTLENNNNQPPLSTITTRSTAANPPALIRQQETIENYRAISQLPSSNHGNCDPTQTLTALHPAQTLTPLHPTQTLSTLHPIQPDHTPVLISARFDPSNAIQLPNFNNSFKFHSMYRKGSPPRIITHHPSHSRLPSTSSSAACIVSSSPIENLKKLDDPLFPFEHRPILIKALVNECEHSADTMNYVLDYYFQTESENIIIILKKINETNEAQSKMFLERLHAHGLKQCIKSSAVIDSTSGYDDSEKSAHTMKVFRLLCLIIHSNEQWLHRIVKDTVMKDCLQAILNKREDPSILVQGCYFFSALTTTIPSELARYREQILNVFKAVCDYLEYNRHENRKTMEHVVLPMFQHVRLNPRLIDGDKNKEVEKDKWRSYECHDLIYESRNICLNPTFGSEPPSHRNWMHELMKRVLPFQHLKEPHTGDSISSQIANEQTTYKDEMILATGDNNISNKRRSTASGENIPTKLINIFNRIFRSSSVSTNPKHLSTSPNNNLGTNENIPSSSLHIHIPPIQQTILTQADSLHSSGSVPIMRKVNMNADAGILITPESLKQGTLTTRQSEHQAYIKTVIDALNKLYDKEWPPALALFFGINEVKVLPSHTFVSEQQQQQQQHHATTADNILFYLSASEHSLQNIEDENSSDSLTTPNTRIRSSSSSSATATCHCVNSPILPPAPENDNGKFSRTYSLSSKQRRTHEHPTLCHRPIPSPTTIKPSRVYHSPTAEKEYFITKPLKEPSASPPSPSLLSADQQIILIKKTDEYLTTNLLSEQVSPTNVMENNAVNIDNYGQKGESIFNKSTQCGDLWLIDVPSELFIKDGDSDIQDISSCTNKIVDQLSLSTVNSTEFKQMHHNSNKRHIRLQECQLNYEEFLCNQYKKKYDKMCQKQKHNHRQTNELLATNGFIRTTKSEIELYLNDELNLLEHHSNMLSDENNDLRRLVVTSQKNTRRRKQPLQLNTNELDQMEKNFNETQKAVDGDYYKLENMKVSLDEREQNVNLPLDSLEQLKYLNQNVLQLDAINQDLECEIIRLNQGDDRINLLNHSHGQYGSGGGDTESDLDSLSLYDNENEQQLQEDETENFDQLLNDAIKLLEEQNEDNSLNHDEIETEAFNRVLSYMENKTHMQNLLLDHNTYYSELYLSVQNNYMAEIQNELLLNQQAYTQLETTVGTLFDRISSTTQQTLIEKGYVVHSTDRPIQSLFTPTGSTHHDKSSSTNWLLEDEDTSLEEDELSNEASGVIENLLKRNKASFEHEQLLLADVYRKNRTYLSIHDDKVYAFNFSYFVLNGEGTYRLILISSKGDADLYVSNRFKHVTYYNYNLSSTTCGIDEIVIDRSIKRPVYIGVYGYSQYRVSYYRLLVEQISQATIEDYFTYIYTSDYFSTKSDENYFKNKNKVYSNIESSSNDYYGQQEQERQGMKPHDHQYQYRELEQETTVKDDDSNDNRHIFWNLFLSILNFLVEVLT
ncbi:unnamed protein product [Didymodactylos carnosus]|uniref:Peptidase M14 domain-containing protein n=1 Tax=Didymodactylos carnosus TaxID=1234261 RepID=A0A8S2CQX0_9BILA|nr:unnamed protein product [Didymodactylos carnosus]CAF3492818.1 unnamed protein product [Didymodactylos carnosus]